MSEEMRETPSGGVARRERRPSTPGLLFALALILLGGALLLANMGRLTVNWAELARYWPVVLILVGLDILIGRRSEAGRALMAVVTIGVIGGVIWLSGRTPAGPTPLFFGAGKVASGTIEEPLRGAKSLKIRADLSTMALAINAQPDVTFAVSGEWTTDERLKPVETYALEGDTAVLTIQQPEANLPFPPGGGVTSQMTLKLPPNLPVELDIQSDLGSQTLDLSGLSVTSLVLTGRSGAISVTLPDAGQMGSVRVHGDLGAVSVQAPPKTTLNVDALQVSAGSGSIDVGLPASGTVKSLDVQGDLGSVTVSVPDDATLQLGSVTVEAGSGSVTVGLPAQGAADDVHVKGDLGSVTIELPGATNTFSVKSFSVEGGSGSVSVTLPARGTYTADISGDLGSITVYLPAGLEAHVDIDPGLSKPDITSQRFAMLGKNSWETLGYKDGENRALVTITAGSGNVEVRDER